MAISRCHLFLVLCSPWFSLFNGRIHSRQHRNWHTRICTDIQRKIICHLNAHLTLKEMKVEKKKWKWLQSVSQCNYFSLSRGLFLGPTYVQALWTRESSRERFMYCHTKATWLSHFSKPDWKKEANHIARLSIHGKMYEPRHYVWTYDCLGF